jgi:hypothetical protein
MADQIRVRWYETGRVLAARLYSSDGRVWSTPATAGLTAFTSANVANYKVALAESPASSYIYTVAFPAAPAGIYDVELYRIASAGGTHALADPQLAVYSLWWTGSAVQTFPTGFASGVQQTGDAYAIVSSATIGNSAIKVAVGTPMQAATPVTLAANAIGSTAISAAGAAEIAAATWDIALTGHTAAGSAGGKLTTATTLKTIKVYNQSLSSE